MCSGNPAGASKKSRGALTCAACLLAGQDYTGGKSGREAGLGILGTQKGPDLCERGTTSTTATLRKTDNSVATLSAGSLQVKAEEGGKEKLVRASKNPKKTNNLFGMVLPREEPFCIDVPSAQVLMPKAACWLQGLRLHFVDVQLP